MFSSCHPRLLNVQKRVGYVGAPSLLRAVSHRGVEKRGGKPHQWHASQEVAWVWTRHCLVRFWPPPSGVRALFQERGSCESQFVRKAQSTRTAKFDPRTLSRKCSRKCPRECTQRCPRKCPRRLRLFLCKTHQRIPTKTPTRVLTGNFPVLTGNFPVHTKLYTKVSSVNFHMSYFHMFCFLANL